MPYANKTDKAAQMRRYRARKRMERNARVNHPANAPIPVQRQSSLSPQQPSRIDPQPSPMSVLKRTMESNPKPAVAPSVGRYTSVAAIPPEVFAKYSVKKEGSNTLSPAPGVDLQAVLRKLLVS